MHLKASAVYFVYLCFKRCAVWSFRVSVRLSKKKKTRKDKSQEGSDKERKRKEERTSSSATRSASSPRLPASASPAPSAAAPAAASTQNCNSVSPGCLRAGVLTPWCSSGALPCLADSSPSELEALAWYAVDVDVELLGTSASKSASLALHARGNPASSICADDLTLLLIPPMVLAMTMFGSARVRIWRKNAPNGKKTRYSRGLHLT